MNRLLKALASAMAAGVRSRSRDGRLFKYGSTGAPHRTYSFANVAGFFVSYDPEHRLPLQLRVLDEARQDRVRVIAAPDSMEINLDDEDGPVARVTLTLWS